MTVGQPQFVGARIKVARAEQHRKELEETIRRFQEAHPYSVEPHHDHGSGDFRLRLTVVHHPPADWGAIIGDALHDWRSALDHLMWEVSGIADDDPLGDRLQFPIYIDRTKYVRDAKSVDRLSQPVAAFIEGVQPYHRSGPGGDPLWLLHVLDRIDKHRTLHVATSVMTANSLGIVELDGYDIHDLTIAPSTQSGADIVSAKLVQTVPAHLARLRMRHEMTVDITFSDGPAAGAVVLKLFEDISNAVQNVVMQVQAKHPSH